MEPATLKLNDNAWHKVHVTRDGKNVRLNIDNGAVDSELLSSCRQGIAEPFPLRFEAAFGFFVRMCAWDYGPYDFTSK